MGLSISVRGGFQELIRQPARLAPRLAEALLVVLFAWQVSGWLLSDTVDEPSGMERLSEEGAPTLPDIAELTAAPLFGKAASIPVADRPQAVKAVARSRLRLKLLGTVVAGSHSAAIVSIQGAADEQVFFIGDRIRPGVVLHEVRADAIIIERDGKLERIDLEADKSRSAASFPAKASFASRGAVSQRQVSRGFLQKQLQDFPRLMSQARVVPHYVDGKVDGFMISDIVSGSLYQKVGLMNGDIIRKINGQKVTSAQQAMAMYKTLQQASSVDLELMRGGSVQRFHYDIR